MKKHIAIPIAALAVIGAGQLAGWVNTGMAHALVAWGGWQAADAAQAAPILCIAGGLGLSLSLYGMYRDSQRYARQSYGRIERCHAHNDEYPELPERSRYGA